MNNLIRELQSASPSLEVVVELELDSGTKTLSQTAPHGIPILSRVSGLLHKLQPAYGKSNIASISVDLIDRSEWGPMVAGNYIKNRRATVRLLPRRSGPGADDWYYEFFTGLVIDYSIKDEVLTIEIRDDLYVAKDKVPEENDTNTQTLCLQNMNPVDIKKLLIETYGGVPSARIDSAQFTAEKGKWFQGWAFDRVLIRPIAIKTLIDELDDQTFSYVFSDGDKITTTSFVPPSPGTTIKELSGGFEKKGTLSVSGMMEDNFFNRCVVYYDYDESGSDNEGNYDSLAMYANVASQGSDQWDEVATKIVKSKWIRSFSIAQPSNITGCVIYNCNPRNGAGSGTLAWNAAAAALTWTAPGGSAGAAVKCDKNGKYQLFSSDTTKYIRVMVTAADLPGGNQSDSLTITQLDGPSIANSLASRWVARYADPQAEIDFSLDLSDAWHNDKLMRVSDIAEVTHDSIVTKGKNGWQAERIFLTSVRPDIEKKEVKISGILTGFKRRYGFIGPASLTVDYDAASEAEREYAFVGDDANMVGSDNEDGYNIY
jgi:hypothetical protein